MESPLFAPCGPTARRPGAASHKQTCTHMALTSCVASGKSRPLSLSCPFAEGT